MPTIVSTPNDYAVEVQNLRGCITTFMVCKYQQGPWQVTRHDWWPATGGRFSPGVVSTADTYSGAVANANAAADHLAAVVANA